MRTDRDLRPADSFLLEENFGLLALLHGGDTVLLVAENERWYRCPLPPLPDR